jgi:hypothetical protein
MEVSYRVFGDFEGRGVNLLVTAHSARQAKFKAGINTVGGGADLQRFMRSTRIKVKRER